MELIKRTYKRTFIILALSILLALKIAGSSSYAEGNSSNLTDQLRTVASVTGPSNHCSTSFLGLESWFNYLPDQDFYTDKTTKLGNGVSKGTENCDIKCFNLFSQGTTDGKKNENACGYNRSDLPLVLLAIIDDLLRVAGLVTLGFVIYGAFLFVTSQGSSEAAAKARNTVINALIGMTIAIVAITFVSFLGSILSGNTTTLASNGSPTSIQPGSLPLSTANSTSLKTILQTVFEILGALAVLMIVIAGLRYVVAGGEPQRTASARNAILYALVGLVIAVSASAIIGFVGGKF